MNRQSGELNHYQSGELNLLLLELSQFVRQYVNTTADEAEQRQYRNAISAATNYRSQIQIHVSKQARFIQFNRWTLLWNIKHIFFFTTIVKLPSFNMAGSSLAL